MTLALTRVGEADRVVRQSLGEQGVPTRSMGTRGHGNEEMSEKGMSPNMLPCGTCPLVSFSLIEDANLHETIVIIESPQGSTSQLYFPCSSLQLLVLGLKFSSQTNRSRSDVLLSSHLAVRVRWFHGHVADQFTQRKWDNEPTRLSSRRQKDTGEASATPPSMSPDPFDLISNIPEPSTGDSVCGYCFQCESAYPSSTLAARQRRQA